MNFRICFLLFFICILQFKFLKCFNFDLNLPVVKRLKKNVYFGYSIAQHFVKSNRTSYLLVGAPRDSLIYNNQVYNLSGAIYKCPINLSNQDDCKQIPVDFKSKNSDEVNDQGKYWDDGLGEQFKGTIFENQWLGVSVASTGNGQFSACAHRYVHHYNFTYRDEHAALGACYRFRNDFVQEYKHVPCLLYSHAVKIFYFNNYAYCQAGTSLSILEDVTLLSSSSQQDTYLSYGMPSAINFRGLVGVKTISKGSKQTDYVYKDDKSYCKFDIVTDKPLINGDCDSLWEKHTYTGMSHALIKRYRNNNKVKLIAAGAPREGLYGLVRFFTFMYDISFGQYTKYLSLTLRGVHKGSYFGFSMAACDLNGDQAEDLIVGAPYFSRKNEPNTGAIYIYMNHKTNGFNSTYVLNFTGESRSLFGHSITCLGDIDKDGFNDFAVGAPYELNPNKENNNTGAVYVYRGNADASKIKQSQKVFSSDFGESVTTFGYSLSGGLDMDSNQYPDLAIGSLNSNTVVVLRTRPVIYFESFVNDKNSLQEIDQKVKECNDVTCFSFEICFRIQSSSTQVDTSNLPKLNYTLEAEPNSTALFSRVYFNSTNSNLLAKSIQLETNGEKKTCDSITVYIKKDNTDYVRPIKFLLGYRFVSPKSDFNFIRTKNNLDEIKKFPVVHEDLGKYEFEANFKKDCGIDKKCVTDLSLKANFVNLIIGDNNIPLISFKESDSVTVGIELENTANYAEPAYAAQVQVEFDERLDFIKKIDLEPTGFSCEINYKIKSNILICKLTNEVQGVPFEANSTARFNLIFSSTRLYRYANISSQPNIIFNIEAKTLSSDVDPTNNVVELLAMVKVRANLFLYGTKTPEQVFYSDNSIIRGESAMTNLEQIGPIIEHTYIINNGGPFSVRNFHLLVDWPYESRLFDFNPINPIKFIDGKHLLYLIEKPTKIPNDHPINVVCSPNPVDSLKISEQSKLAIQKRSVEKEVENTQSRVATIDCFSNTAYCFKINCTFSGDFSKDEIISLKFTARLWNSTLVEDFPNFEKVLIKSHARIVLNDDIHDDRPNDNENSVTTVAYSKIKVKIEKTLPLWLYLLSVLIGLIILLVCIIGFWMLGFFERKKFGDDLYMENNEKVKKTPY